MPRKKVLFLITKSNWGGAQRYVYDLATSLSKETFDVAVAFGGTGLPHAKTGPLHTKLEKVGIRAIPIKRFARDVFPLLDVRALFELITLLRVERPDILHTNSSKAGGLGALAGRITGVKRIVFTSHGLAYDEDRAFFICWMIAFFTWLSFFLSHEIILITKGSYKRVSKMPFMKYKTHLIHNGISTPIFLERGKARAELARIGDIKPPQEVLWIGTIAELTKNKGLNYSIEACEYLHKNKIPYAFFIIGRGEEKNELEKCIENVGLKSDVLLLGFVENAYRYLRAFDVFLLSSVKEGLPYVLIESGEAKLPVVSSNVGGIPDIIEDGVSGLISPLKDSESLALSLEKLATNPKLRESMGEALFKHLRAEFSIERMVRETEEIYLHS